MSGFLRDRYLAGLVDGEGCFIVSKVAKRSACHISLHVSLRLDTASVLRELASVFGGRLHVSEVKASVNPKHKPLLMWAITSKQDVLGLIAYFNEFELVVKAAQYQVWRDAALFYYRYSKGTGGGRNPEWLVEAMLSAKTELERLKKYDAESAGFFVKSSSDQLELFDDADTV